jgi:hypothetical protein
MGTQAKGKPSEGRESCFSRKTAEIKEDMANEDSLSGAIKHLHKFVYFRICEELDSNPLVPRLFISILVAYFVAIYLETHGHVELTVLPRPNKFHTAGIVLLFEIYIIYEIYNVCADIYHNTKTGD